MIVEKGLLVTTVVVFAGFVGYKVLKKKKPAMFKKFKASIFNAGKKISEMAIGAKESFREGYQRT